MLRYWLYNFYKADPGTIMDVMTSDKQTEYIIIATWSLDYTIDLFSDYFIDLVDQMIDTDIGLVAIQYDYQFIDLHEYSD
jgi:hypothetical protein